MAVTYGFYDSLNHDRLYNAQQMSAIFDGIINDGVFMSVGNQFHTVAGTGMQVIVKSGRAWFDSTWTLNDAEYPLSIDAADVLLTRIDAVVLEVNSEVATRANTIKVVKGTPASTPAKPTLTNTATIHQHALAYVTVAKNTTAITNSMIEIVVGKTETPYVTAILQTTDITDLYNQWEDYFQTWFDTVRGTLDGDVALNLQNQITSLRRETLKNTTPPIIGLPASATPDDMFQALAKTGELHVWRKTTGYAAIPAGTTTTYPVSTNPNAYQEGSDAKPAGYVLGDVVTGNFSLTVKGDGSTTITWLYSSAVTVSDNGEISFVDSTSSTINAYDYASNAQKFKGKFCKTSFDGTDFAPNEVCFIPANASIVQSGDKLVVDRYQPVTGYAAIPAGTTIEYLGKLGDKSKVQVVSYIGTNTYGQNNPQKVSVDFRINSILYLGYYSHEYGFYHIFSANSSRVYVNINQVSTVYEHYIGFHNNAEYVYGKKSQDEKTFFWYSSNGVSLNSSGYTYYFLVIG